MEPKLSTESSRTRLTIGTWEARTAALLPQSVSPYLPSGVVAVRVSTPADLLEAQLVWHSDNESPTVAAFIELSSRVFATTERA